MAMDDDDMEITVEYKSAKTDLADVDGLETRMTKEEMALDILTGWENIIPFIIISSAITQMSVSVSSIKAMMEEKWFIPMFLLCL